MITIDKGIPLPTRGVLSEYPFAEMEVGDSLQVKSSKQVNGTGVNVRRQVPRIESPSTEPYSDSLVRDLPRFTAKKPAPPVPRAVKGSRY